MSLKSFFQEITPNKILGYGVAASAAVPAAMDIVRMVNGDISATATFAQNFSIAAAGYGIAQSAPPKKAPAQASPSTMQLIMPRRGLVMV